MNTAETQRHIFRWVVFISALAAIFIIMRFNYLLFHTLSEMFSVVIAFGVFTIAWNSKKYIDNQYFLFIGISFLFTGIIDLFHTFSYKGINIIPGYDANLPTQLWIIGRYIESTSFLIAPFFIHRKAKLNPHILFFTMAAITGFLLFLAFNRMFPACFIEGYGLTNFKKISEIVISAVLVMGIILLFLNKKYFDRKIFYMISAALVFTIISEMFFTFYINVYEISNVIGHLFKITAFYLFYLAIVHTGIEKPYQLIFRELKRNEEKLSAIALTDELTGLFNRRGCYEHLRKMMALSKRDKSPLTICLIDLDNLKEVNDNYGHSEGDKLLKIFSDTLKKYARESDYMCRIGGDEFLLIFRNCTLSAAEKYIARIRDGIAIVNKSSRRYKISFSYGLSEFNYSSSEHSIDKIIEIADKNMYKDKSAKRSID